MDIITVAFWLFVIVLCLMLVAYLAKFFKHVRQSKASAPQPIIPTPGAEVSQLQDMNPAFPANAHLTTEDLIAQAARDPNSLISDADIAQLPTHAHSSQLMESVDQILAHARGGSRRNVKKVKRSNPKKKVKSLAKKAAPKKKVVKGHKGKKKGK